MIARGASLSHYRIVRPLGSGGMADVYEAEDEKLGRRVALKVLPPELGRKPDFVRRFEKEVRAAASLNHPGIVTVFEVGEAQGCLFYAMRLLPGGELSDRIRDGMTARQSLALVREVADAFDHAHSHGLVHRDVKPANIMFDEHGRAVLTDFGIVKALAAETHLTAIGMAVGTPRYMSPEQARGLQVDARADLYGLGVILHEMLTGRLPFEAPESISVIFMHLNEPIPRLPAEHATLQPLLDSLMAKDPADRPASAAALIRMVDALCAPEAPVARATPERDIATVLAPIQMTATQRSAVEATTIDPITIRRPWRGAVLIGAGLLAALLLALGWSVSIFAPRTAPAPPETPIIAVEASDPAVEQIPEPIKPTSAPSSEEPAAKSAAIAAPAEEVPPTVDHDGAKDRVASARTSSPPKEADPECDELHMLFGLGQTLSAAQQEYLTKKCR